LILQDQRQTFRAFVHGSPSAKAPHFAPGSQVRLRGIATSLPQLSSGIYPFTIVANRVELVSPPPWWPLPHIVLLVIAVLVMLLALRWISHQIRHWQMRAMLREREELAYEVHDTLAQSFTGIAYQLQAARTERRGEDAVQEHIGSALRLVSISHREASRTIAFVHVISVTQGNVRLRPDSDGARDLSATDFVTSPLIDGHIGNYCATSVKQRIGGPKRCPSLSRFV
jgi:hypothetical protein